MSYSQQKQSTESIKALVAQNFYAFREYFANISNAQIRNDRDLSLINTGIPYPSWNAIICKNPEINFFQLNVSEYLSFYNFPLSWWFGPEMALTGFEQLLLKYGFKEMGNSAAMAIEIDKFEYSYSRKLEIEILPVTGTTGLEHYLRVLKKSFQMPQFTIDALYGLYSQSSHKENSTFYHYIGLIKGKPVGCASLFLVAGSAGIYHVGTLPGFRGRGIGKLMTTHCLKKAHEMDYDFAVLRASKLGERIYQQLGFKEYGQFRQYNLYKNHYRNYIWKCGYYLNSIKDKFIGDAIWFS